MSQKKNNSPKKDTSNHYKLNTKAVDRLVNADKLEIPPEQKMKDPGKKYRSSILDNIPGVVKTLFVKFWFNGAVCYFILWGLGMYVTDMLDMIVVLSIVLGMITDILVNNTIRFIEVVPGENAKFMMFPKKKYWTFFANILYSGLVLICVIYFYQSINVVLGLIRGVENEITIGVEPILFGLFYMMFDLLFVGMKNLMLKIIQDAKNKSDK
ncbi:MAG: hypothetical protein ACI3XL_03300 [Eubacteriales bacterium]